MTTPNSEKGKGFGPVEYAILLILVCIVFIAGLAILQPKFDQEWHRGSYLMSGKVVGGTTLYQEPIFVIHVESVSTDKSGYIPHLIQVGNLTSFFSTDNLNWNTFYSLSCIQAGRISRCNIRNKEAK